ncbi:MAG: Outer membrane protein W precursor [uncultured Paraburkholderia sp.]|nr:MAG: Outer membrane protein W precursor [uncultured Paraburkholderia sp.]
MKGDSSIADAIIRGLAVAIATTPFLIACGGGKSDNPGPINAPQCSGSSCGVQGPPASSSTSAALCPATGAPPVPRAAPRPTRRRPPRAHCARRPLKEEQHHEKICLAILAACLSVSAHAQHAGDNVAVLGWFHVMPKDSSTPITTNVAPTPINTPLRLPNSFTSAGTSLSTNTANTVGLVMSHYLTDHIAVTTVAGVPPVFKIYGHGTIKPPGPAGALGQQNIGDPQTNPIVKSMRQWSPALLFQYYFNTPTAKFRPFVGVGVSYNWFSDIQLSQNFVQSTQDNLGAILAAGAGKPGKTQVSAKASSSWAPVFNAGLAYNITDHWGLVASVTYIPLKTTSSCDARAAASGAANRRPSQGPAGFVFLQDGKGTGKFWAKKARLSWRAESISEETWRRQDKL